MTSSDTTIQVQLKNQSLVDILDKYPDLIYSTWYRIEPFAQKKHTGIWEVTPQIESSISRIWDEQQKLIPKGEEVPPAVVLVVALLAHYGDTGERLLPDTYSYTSDVRSDGCRVYVGLFLAGGLYVFSYWGGGRSDDLGVSSSRKLKKLDNRTFEPSEPLDSVTWPLPDSLEINGQTYVRTNQSEDKS